MYADTSLENASKSRKDALGDGNRRQSALMAADPRVMLKLLHGESTTADTKVSSEIVITSLVCRGGSSYGI